MVWLALRVAPLTCDGSSSCRLTVKHCPFLPPNVLMLCAAWHRSWGSHLWRVSVWLCLSYCTDANALGRGGLFWVVSGWCWGFWLFRLGCLGWFGLGWFVRWPPLHRVLFSLLETSLTHYLSCLRVRLRDAGSWVTVGFGAVFLVWVWCVWWFLFVVCRALAFSLPSLATELPFFGTGPPSFATLSIRAFS